MNYSQVTDPKWADEENTIINCNVLFDNIGTLEPFTANPNDTSNPSSKQIFDECVAGIYGEVKPYVEPPPYVPSADFNKQTAIGFLQQTDWTTIGDIGNPELCNPYLANQSEFIAYRNVIRQFVFNPVEGDINWPAMPQEDWQTV